MTTLRLIIEGTWPRQRRLSTDEFIWRAASDETSFLTGIGPMLDEIGRVRSENIDLVALALLTFLADRTVARPSGGWEREITLALPVFDVSRWRSVSLPLTQTLEVLTGDRWSLDLKKRALSRAKHPAERPEIDRVLLFSGGADSLCGAITALERGERLLLVSHWDWSGHSAYQTRLADWLSKRFPGQVWHRQHRVGRRATQLGGGRFEDEPTRRSRSLLFIALGLAHASVAPEVPLWIAENGFAALNPPLAGERRGALSTRTTHPEVLARLERIVIDVGGHYSVVNPFISSTKGAMFIDVARILGRDDAEKVLSLSHSCAHVRWATGTGLSPDTQCGVCFGCLLRRAAFHASNLRDQTVYLHTALPPSSQPEGLRRAASHEVRAVRYAGRRGVTAADLLSAGLPQGFSVDEAVDIASRGLEELSGVIEVTPDLARVS